MNKTVRNEINKRRNNMKARVKESKKNAKSLVLKPSYVINKGTGYYETKCPHCGNTIHSSMSNCPKCNQAIDWSEE